MPGVIRSTGEPIKSPVNGAPHRVRIDLPNGIEFDVAEIGNGVTDAEGAIKLDLKNTYAQFNFLRHTGQGSGAGEVRRGAERRGREKPSPLVGEGGLRCEAAG